MAILEVLLNKLREFEDGYSKSYTFILGLVFSYGLLENALLNILITYLTDELQEAVVVVSLLDGTAAFLQIFFAFLVDDYTGRFTMLAYSTTLSVVGLLLCVASSLKDGDLDISLLYPALLLMAFSRAGKEVTLKAFLRDQLLPRDRRATEEDEVKATKGSDIWWNFVSLLAAISAIGVASINAFRNLSIVLASVMGVSLLLFLLGIRFYRFYKPTGSSLSDIGVVIYNAIRNEQHQAVEIPPDVRWLRWLNRAAAVDDCSVEQVKGVKSLMQMLPMSLTFLIFCLVYIAGRTFFLEEAQSMITGKSFPILLVIILPKLVEYAVSGAFVFVLKKLGINSSTQRMKLLRILSGMMCCVPCCIVAWFNNANNGNVVDEADYYDVTINMLTLLRLFPQFFLLELMRRLSKEGLMHYFESQVSESISPYGPQFGECVMGIGKFVSVVFILFLSKWFGWFGDTVRDSHLDRYYLFLAGLSIVNIILYCWVMVAHWYGEDTFLIGDEEQGNSSTQVEVELTALQNDVEDQEEVALIINGPTYQNSSSPANANLLVERLISFPQASSRGIKKRNTSMQNLTSNQPIY